MHDTTAEERARSLALDLGDDFMDLFHDDDVTEVGVNPFRENIWADTRSQDKVETSVVLLDATIRNFLQRAAGYNDETLTADDPDLESSLPNPIWNGSRLSGAVPPAVPAPSFSIRKFEGDLIPLESYVDDQIMSQRQYDRLIDAIKHYENIAIVGGTGSGKTTLLMSVLNKMGDFFESDRFVTIEDTPEINLESAWNWFAYYTFEADDDYRGSVTDRVHRSLRQSPDRLIVGECRGPGIVALFEGLLSGHPGGAFTYHATSIQQLFKRVLINCKRESDTSAHKQNIGDAIDVIIILEKAMGVRYVKQFAVLDRYSRTDDRYVYDRIWRDPDDQPDKFIPEEVRGARSEASTSSEF
ncbi:ATPase, T2SS/T4P/T4SS family [Salinibacter ruber]|jgi:Flp pilus assembly CpaF family ATPase|uniref:Type IV secretion system protein VirB11 n=1 Tax=Salinibacter ruber TaxID=146919 RepID=A0A9X2Q5K2_9BACT|nr:ATPase, T2SS/T4P/T4SS family [Salinibacter ruber]MCS3660166.1 type IV secretion system protein VirB11 [Salinibacter ruber]MCS3709851.1 type IV secretion system protein VirB11 [Salinibacter ruber]MCS4170321.1 type IV secretion system protein VirB11 [Salinibacter ruber]